MSFCQGIILAAKYCSGIIRCIISHCVVCCVHHQFVIDVIYHVASNGYHFQVIGIVICQADFLFLEQIGGIISLKFEQPYCTALTIDIGNIHFFLVIRFSIGTHDQRCSSFSFFKLDIRFIDKIFSCCFTE